MPCSILGAWSKPVSSFCTYAADMEAYDGGGGMQ